MSLSPSEKRIRIREILYFESQKESLGQGIYQIVMKERVN
jgi:hypothetical protein